MDSPRLNLADLDRSLRPGDDFFAYVNGTWLAKNPIPADESRWGSFTMLRVQVEEQLKAIIDELVAGDPAAVAANGSTDPERARKVRDFYMTGMDVAKLNALRTTPLGDLMALVGNMADKKEVARVTGVLHRAGVGGWFAPFVDQDEKESSMMALHLYQGGLSLPDRDYYLNEDEKSREIRKKFSEYAKALAGLAGMDAPVAAEIADAVLRIETTLAKASRTRVELRDVERQYNKVAGNDLATRMGAFAMADYFAAIGMPVPAYFIVGQPEFFDALDAALASLSLEDVKMYCSWHLLNDFAKYLSEDFEKLQFDFYGRVFGGAKEMKPRWRRVLGTTNGLLDEAVGELYVARHFSPEAKQKITTLVDNLVAAYRTRIEGLTWMAAATKERALDKLSKFSRKLGYPDKWKDIGTLMVGTDSYAANVMHAHAFEFDRQMNKVGKPVDRAEWLMPPQMVNAYYQPPMNEIVFPAAILQPPFFDPRAEDALNYGGIGTVIGHELTHGFDDQGALFNGEGNIEHWWTKEDKERFDARTAHLAAQFDAFEPLPGLHINGKLTLGENIADLGGILIAYDALQIALQSAAKDSATPLAATPTPTQKFFMNYAVTERGSEREEYQRMVIQVDPHSPGKYRVLGPLSNIDAFYDAFDVKPTDKMWRAPDDRIKIW